jgi:cytochrome c biogenesis protein CcmG, thiol:disulfide interchange protein DsbE
VAATLRAGGLIALVCAVSMLAVHQCRAAEVGERAPALVIRLLDGRMLDLAELRGQVVVLNFWATWCAPCRNEMPMLEAFYRAHRSEGVAVIGVSVDSRSDRKDVVGVMRGCTYPAALLEDATVDGFGMPVVLPVSYIVDAQGVIRTKFMPTPAGLTEPELAAAVLLLIDAGSSAR